MPPGNKVLETDVLVVGSEGAGSRAAVEVARKGLRTLIVTKGRFTKCGATLTADMDIDLPSADAKDMFGLDGDSADTPEAFAQDMFEEGKYMNNEEVVLAHCKNAGKYIKELADAGMIIEGLVQSPGHRYPRGILSTGRSMMEALKRLTRGCKIDWCEDAMITNLLTKDGRVTGAVGLSIRTGEFLTVKAKAVVLATGGTMMCYPITTAPEELTGEGFIMAYEAGAELVDMEFPLFLPACCYWPESMKGVDFPYIFTTTIGGWWLNKFGDRFIDKWDPVRKEQGTTRDIASISQAMEALEGRGGPHGGIYASCKHVPNELMEYSAEQMPWWRNFVYGKFKLSEFNMDPRKVSYEVGPASHYWNGGIKVNGKGATNVPGLYAAGEVQGGTMGANRLSGNAVTECLVFGALAGEAAADYAKGAASPEIDKNQVDKFYEELHQPLNRKDGADAYEMRFRMQKSNFKNIGPVRWGSSINECLDVLAKIDKDDLPNLATKSKAKVYNREWMVAVENKALVRVAEIVARASLMRTESRGAMYRLDHTETDNANWLKNIIVTQKNGKVNLETKPVETSSIKLPEKTKTPYLRDEWKFEKKA